MAKKDKPELEEMTAPFWLVTFSDLVTLLMVFFILILSFSTIQLEKFRGAMSSMKGALGVMPENISTYSKPKSNFEKKEEKVRREIEEEIRETEEILAAMGLSDIVEIEFTGDGIMVRMGDNLLFSSGQAMLKNQALPVIDLVLQAFGDKYDNIYVEGHTDNIPISSKQFPSNWELSSGRSLSVVRYLNNKGKVPANKLTAVGHGEHRPLIPNSDSKSRSKNRRVEIFFKM